MEDVEKLRSQILAQIDRIGSLDPSQKAEMKKKIEDSSQDELISFVSQGQQQKGGSCIFCSISNGEVDSFKVKDNDKAVAVLEINPASKGHVIIIPKSHGSVFQDDSSIKSLISDVSKRLQDVLNPEKIEVSKQEIMGHGIINLIPVFSGVALKKKPANPDDLENLMSDLSKEQIKIDKKVEQIILPSSKPKKQVTKQDDKKEEKPTDQFKSEKKLKKFVQKSPSRIP